MDENKLLCLYEPLIIKLATEYYSYSNSPSLDIDDFIQDARLGFILALRKFDENKGTAFSSFVTYGIKLELRDTLSKRSHLIKIPRYRLEQARKILKAINDLVTKDIRIFGNK